MVRKTRQYRFGIDQFLSYFECNRHAIAWSSYAAPAYSNCNLVVGILRGTRRLIIAFGAERFPRPSDRPMVAMMRASGLIRETVSDAS